MGFKKAGRTLRPTINFLGSHIERSVPAASVAEAWRKKAHLQRLGSFRGLACPATVGDLPLPALLTSIVGNSFAGCVILLFRAHCDHVFVCSVNYLQHLFGGLASLFWGHPGLQRHFAPQFDATITASMQPNGRMQEDFVMLVFVGISIKT